MKIEFIFFNNCAMSGYRVVKCAHKALNNLIFAKLILLYRLSGWIVLLDSEALCSTRVMRQIVGIKNPIYVIEIEEKTHEKQKQAFKGLNLDDNVHLVHMDLFDFLKENVSSISAVYADLMGYIPNDQQLEILSTLKYCNVMFITLSQRSKGRNSKIPGRVRKLKAYIKHLQCEFIEWYRRAGDTQNPGMYLLKFRRIREQKIPEYLVSEAKPYAGGKRFYIKYKGIAKPTKTKSKDEFEKASKRKFIYDRNLSIVKEQLHLFYGPSEVDPAPCPKPSPTGSAPSISMECMS